VGVLVGVEDVGVLVGVGEVGVLVGVGVEIGPVPTAQLRDEPARGMARRG
jgi:hypothetical protein